MIYYLVETGRYESDLPDIKDLYHKINVKGFFENQSYQIGDRTILMVSSSPHTIYRDILLGSVPLFSERIMPVVQTFVPDDIIYKQIILLDPGQKKSSSYRLPFFRRFPAESLRQDKHGIWLGVEKRELEDCSVFYVRKDDKCQLFMGLDLIECLLRNGVAGIRLEPVMVEGGV